MEGLSEAINQIQNTAVKASGAQEVHHEDPTVNLLCVDGKIEKHSVPPPPRRHVVCDLDSLSSIVGTWPEPTVWHNNNAVVAVLDDGGDTHRLNKAEWKLVASGKYNALTESAGSPRSHKDFVSFLVRNLRDELDAAAPGLLGTIRNLKFKSVDAAEGNVQQGRESMGRQIDSEVTGAGELPETVKVKVRRWAGLDCFTEIECLLVLDTQDRTLALKPLADQKVQAENESQEWLHGQITDAVECPVFHGSP